MQTNIGLMAQHKIWLLTIFTILSFNLFGQKTTFYTEMEATYKSGIMLYEDALYGKAKFEFNKVLNDFYAISGQEADNLKQQSELYIARCAVRQKSPEGERLILNFVRKYQPDPLADEALIEIANYYFNAKDYDKAIEFFKEINTYGLTAEQRSETKFKLGYAYFVKKKFSEAKNQFTSIQNEKNKYYYPTNYYLGMIAFFNDDYTGAIAKFTKIEKSKKYKKLIPYYICQIHFAKGEYDKMITYGEKLLSNSTVKHQKEIRQMLGQSYFERGDFEKAEPHLEYYADRSNKMRIEDFYQLGYVQHKNGHYNKAIQQFEELKNEQSTIGQNAMYNLGDCYIQVKDKSSAKNAFGKAAKMRYDKDIQEESLWNYIKLSYELGADRDAITGIEKIKTSSVYYREAQSLMGDLFLKTRDYAKALKIIEDIPNKTPKLKETYQKIAFNRALQFSNDGDQDNALNYFNKSLKYPIDQNIKAQSYFWKGEIKHNRKNYAESIVDMGKFLTLANSVGKLPQESAVYMGNYIQGYNYIKQKDYNTALAFFRESVAQIRSNQAIINNTTIKSNLYGDAILRAGDCYFKKNDYSKALQYYNDNIQQKYPGFVYALFQKAIIQGLQQKPTEKILALEEIEINYAKSPYADDALLELGTTYQSIDQLTKAKKPLRKLVKNYSKTSPLVNQALIRLGIITFNQGNTDSAIKYYKDVFDHNPNASESKQALAGLEEIYVDELGQPDKYFEFVEQINGGNIGDLDKDAISFKAAESQYENGKYDNAITAYGNYIIKYPKGQNALLAHYHRADCYSVKKKYSKALIDYEYVIDKGSNRYLAKCLKNAAIIVYNQDKDFEKGYKYYSQWEKIADNDTDKFEAQLGAMRCAYRTNKTSEVVKMAEKVSQNDLASKETKATAQFYLGKVAYDIKKYDKALTAFNEVIANSDNAQTAESRYLIAYIYYIQGELEISQQLCLNSYQESSAYENWVAKSVILLSDIFRDQGDIFNAKAALEGLIENFDSDQDILDLAKAKLKALEKIDNTNNRLVPDNSDSNNNLQMEEDEE